MGSRYQLASLYTCSALVAQCAVRYAGQARTCGVSVVSWRDWRSRFLALAAPGFRESHRSRRDAGWAASRACCASRAVLRLRRPLLGRPPQGRLRGRLAPRGRPGVRGHPSCLESALRTSSRKAEPNFCLDKVVVEVFLPTISSLNLCSLLDTDFRSEDAGLLRLWRSPRFAPLFGTTCTASSPPTRWWWGSPRDRISQRVRIWNAIVGGVQRSNVVHCKYNLSLIKFCICA